MKQKILNHLNNPGQLEKMYRADKANFKKEFDLLYPRLKDNPLAEAWHVRLNYPDGEINWGTGRELLLIGVLALAAGFMAKLPGIFAISEDFFYPRNAGFTIFPALMIYFTWKNRLTRRKITIIVGAILAGSVFINFLPDTQNSDTLILSCLHLLLFLWFILGFAFVGEGHNLPQRSLDFLKYNGDGIVITTLILLAGAILSGITIGLFSLLGFNIEEFYFSNIVVFGLPAAPIVGTFLIQTNPNLVGRVSPVIAKIFSPLVLVMVVVYLAAILVSGKDPYNDREFLLFFNALLVGVMALIFFSVAETSKSNQSRLRKWVLFLLSMVTVIVNGIALSAILFRITEWGITPNRAAVLGGNVLILIHLLIVAVRLYRVLFRKDDLAWVGTSITWYMPVYFLWAIVVTFVFPFLFGFK